MRVLVTGGAGFLGSHLCDALVARGDSVVCADDLSTGRLSNVDHLLADPRFTFLQVDVSESIPLEGRVDAVAHLASPASPPDYHRRPLETMAVGSAGTDNALRIAHACGARFLLASTSEVYGDPLVHPQDESYFGNVNPIGPRSIYDEAKRYAEALTAAYRRTHGVDTGIVRIFNTYGPRMRPHDGRVVTSFIAQALTGDPLTIYGDGGQTRSFCHVDDLVRGLVAMLDSDTAGPINLGNPVERTVTELAELVLAITGSSSGIEYHPLPQDDPTRRRPVIDRARAALGWTPQVSTEEGLRLTVEYFRAHRDEVDAAREAIAGGQPGGTSAVPAPRRHRAGPPAATVPV